MNSVRKEPSLASTKHIVVYVWSFWCAWPLSKEQQLVVCKLPMAYPHSPTPQCLWHDHPQKRMHSKRPTRDL